MECYYVETKNPEALKGFAKQNFKTYSIWEPPEDLFVDCVFVMTDDPIPVKGKYVFKVLTADLYRQITDESVGVQPTIAPEDVIKVKDKVSVISPAFSFKGVVNRIKDGLISVAGKVFEGKKKKNIKITVPEEYVSKIQRKKKK